MSFEDITIVKGEAFVSLAAMIETAEVKGLPVRFCQDEGGVKVKIGSYTWSPALGERDPECAAARAMRTPPDTLDQHDAHAVQAWLREPVAQSVDWRAEATPGGWRRPLHSVPRPPVCSAPECPIEGPHPAY